MFNSQLIIYNHPILYKILLEIKTDLKFELIFADNIKDIQNYIKKNSYIVLTNNKNCLDNELVIEQFPLKITYLIHPQFFKRLKMFPGQRMKKCIRFITWVTAWKYSVNPNMLMM